MEVRITAEMDARDAHQPVSLTRHEVRQKECHTQTNHTQLGGCIGHGCASVGLHLLGSRMGSLLVVGEATGYESVLASLASFALHHSRSQVFLGPPSASHPASSSFDGASVDCGPEPVRTVSRVDGLYNLSRHRCYSWSTLVQIKRSRQYIREERGWKRKCIRIWSMVASYLFLTGMNNTMKCWSRSSRQLARAGPPWCMEGARHESRVMVEESVFDGGYRAGNIDERRESEKGKSTPEPSECMLRSSCSSTPTQ
jgi:hypothetical protein